MRGTQLFAGCAAFVFLAASLHADCIKGHDYRSSPTSGVLITDLTITGTQTLSSSDVSAITNKMIGSCINDNSEEINERIKALFQDRGYFAVEIKSLRIKPVDPVAQPKPVTLEAEVAEGTRYRLAEIDFEGNHAFTTSELRDKFPFKKGDLFSRAKVASGLDTLRASYLSNGFIDSFFIPDVRFLPDATVVLSVEVTEGLQFHMGKLEIFARKEVAEKLGSAWELPEGAIFDFTYIDKYIGSNRSLLPSEFTREGVQPVRDCRDATVEVRVVIDPLDPRAQSQPQETPCESPDKNPK